LGEKCFAWLPPSRTNTLSSTSILQTRLAQHGHGFSTTRSRALRCIIPRPRTTLTSHPNPTILRTAPPISLPPVRWWIQHHYHVSCDRFGRHTHFWPGRARYLTRRGATAFSILNDRCCREAPSHLGRELYVTPGTTTEAISSGPCRCRCRSPSVVSRSLAWDVISLRYRRGHPAAKGCHDYRRGHLGRLVGTPKAANETTLRSRTQGSPCVPSEGSQGCPCRRLLVASPPPLFFLNSS